MSGSSLKIFDIPTFDCSHFKELVYDSTRVRCICIPLMCICINMTWVVTMFELVAFQRVQLWLDGIDGSWLQFDLPTDSVATQPIVFWLLFQCNFSMQGKDCNFSHTFVYGFRKATQAHCCILTCLYKVESSLRHLAPKRTFVLYCVLEYSDLKAWNMNVVDWQEDMIPIYR